MHEEFQAHTVHLEHNLLCLLHFCLHLLQREACYTSEQASPDLHTAVVGWHLRRYELFIEESKLRMEFGHIHSYVG